MLTIFHIPPWIVFVVGSDRPLLSPWTGSVRQFLSGRNVNNAHTSMPDRQSAQAPILATISQDQTPSLTVSQSAVEFAPTSPGNATFQIVTIVYPPAYAPVSLSVDAPDYFMLATDSHPKFAPSLAFTPSSLYSYVHVRYLADRRGLHTGQLTIRSGSESLAVSLTGQSSLLAPAGRSVRAVIRRPPSSRSGWRAKNTIVGILILLVAGLAYLTYANRRLLFSDMDSDPVTVHAPAPAERTVHAPAPAERTAPGPAAAPARVSARTKPTLKATGERRGVGALTEQKGVDQSTRELDRESVTNRKSRAKETAALPADVRQSTRVNANANPVVGEAPQKRRANALEESDLERELNKPKRDPLR